VVDFWSLVFGKSKGQSSNGSYDNTETAEERNLPVGVRERSAVTELD
jgi:hypothetical protein